MIFGDIYEEIYGVGRYLYILVLGVVFWGWGGGGGVVYVYLLVCIKLCIGEVNIWCFFSCILIEL